MYGMILQGARSLGVEGMERLIADLKAAILSALAGGSQRWLRRGCGRSFSASTGRVLALSKLTRRHLGVLRRGDGRRREPGAPRRALRRVRQDQLVHADEGPRGDALAAPADARRRRGVRAGRRAVPERVVLGQALGDAEGAARERARGAPAAYRR